MNDKFFQSKNIRHCWTPEKNQLGSEFVNQCKFTSESGLVAVLHAFNYSIPSMLNKWQLGMSTVAGTRR